MDAPAAARRIRRRDFLRGGLALAGSLTAARCLPQPAPSPTAQPAPTDELLPEIVVNTAAEKESADPLLVYQVDGGSVDRNLFDHLLERDWQGNVVPGLAEAFEPLDETTIEFRLRRDVAFHNGEPFDAESVQFSFERVLDPELGSAWAGNLQALDRVEIVDPHTVRLHLKEPSAPLLDVLVSAPAMEPARLIRQQGYQAFLSHPVGTGPYRYVEWVKDSHFTLERNPDDWPGSPKGRPFARRAVFKPVPEAPTRLANLATGAAHIVRAVPPDLAPTIERGEAVWVDVPRVAFMQIAADRPPFDDARARQALNHAVDVELIIQTLLGGRGQRLATVFAPQSLGFTPEVRPFEHDPDRAGVLLRQAGVPEGFELEVDYATLERKDIVEAIAAQLEEVGLRPRVRGFEVAVFNDNWAKKNTGHLRFATWGPLFDPWSILNLVIKPGGLLSRYTNQEATTLIERGQVELDRQERAGIYHELMRALRDDPACIYLYNHTTIFGLAPEAAAFQPRPDEYVLLTRA